MVRAPHSKFDFATSNDGEWTINGSSVEPEILTSLRDKVSDPDIERWGSIFCPFCALKLKRSSFDDILYGDESWHNNRYYVLNICRRCLHWEFQGFEGGNKCMDATQSILVASVAAKFDPTLPEGCSAELAQHLRRNRNHWHHLSPLGMEKLVADLFRANHSNAEVMHVGRPGDRGVDVIFVDDSRTTWLIQVKRRARAGKAEGFATLQSILGTLALTGERHGIVASTADYFSHQARVEAERARQQGFVVQLLDKGVLDRMVGSMLPIAPWKALFEDPRLAYLGEDVRSYFLAHYDQLDLFGDVYS